MIKKKKINIDDEGKVYLDGLNKFILDQSMISKENIKSINCGYLKVLKNYELHSSLWLFIELRSNQLKNKKDIKQFMVWNGQCGIKPFGVATNKYSAI